MFLEIWQNFPLQASKVTFMEDSETNQAVELISPKRGIK